MRVTSFSPLRARRGHTFRKLRFNGLDEAERHEGLEVQDMADDSRDSGNDLFFREKDTHASSDHGRGRPLFGQRWASSVSANSLQEEAAAYWMSLLERVKVRSETKRTDAR